MTGPASPRARVRLAAPPVPGSRRGPVRATIGAARSAGERRATMVKSPGPGLRAHGDSRRVARPRRCRSRAQRGAPHRSARSRLLGPVCSAPGPTAAAGRSCRESSGARDAEPRPRHSLRRSPRRSHARAAVDAGVWELDAGVEHLDRIARARTARCRATVLPSATAASLARCPSATTPLSWGNRPARGRTMLASRPQRARPGRASSPQAPFPRVQPLSRLVQVPVDRR